MTDTVLPTLASADLPPRVRRILTTLQAVALARVAPDVQAAIEALQQQLQLETAQAAHPTVRDAAVTAARTLHQLAPELPVRFAAHVQAQLAGLRSAPTTPVAAQPVIARRLALLDNHVLDEQAELREIAARLNARASHPLYLIGQRMGVLAASPALEPQELPLGPLLLCEALRRAASDLGLALALRIRLLRQMELALLANYAGHAEALDAALVGEGVLPHLTYVPLRPQQPRQADTSRPSPGSQRPAQAPGDRGAATQAAATRDGAPMPVEGAGVRAQLAMRRQVLGKLRAPDQSRQRSLLTRDEVLAALMRARTAVRPPPSIAEARLAVLAQARQQHAQGVMLDGTEADVFDLLDLYYVQLWRHLRVDAAGAGHARKLMLPALEHAVRDADAFLDDRAHPVREVLAAITAGGGLHDADDDADPQAQAVIAGIVEATVQRAIHDTRAFAHAQEQLQTQLQPLARRADMATRRHVDAARGREKLAHAHQGARQTLKQAMQGRPLPAWHRQMLEQVWLDAMTMTLLRHGETSGIWARQRTLTDQLAQPVPQIADEDGSLMEALVDAMQQLGHSDAEARLLADCLLQPEQGRCQAAMAGLHVNTRLGAVDDEPTEQTAALDAAQQAARERLAAHAEGAWLLLPDALAGRQLYRHLAWCSAQTGGVLFTGHRGQRIEGLPQDLDTLARLLASGKARLLGEQMPPLPGHVAWQAVQTTLDSFTPETDA